MPELPEVEVVKRSLKRGIINLSIKKVIIKTNKLRYILNKNKFKLIKNKKITKIRRRSKYIIIFFDSNFSMLIHLGMTGKFFFQKKNISLNLSFYHNNQKERKHDHIIFVFNSNLRLIFNDVRKFGFIKIYEKKKFLLNQHFKNLGPEPLKNKFNYNYLKTYIEGRKRTIKDLLMDQKCVSGLGNIYVNEILFFSGVRPAKKIKKITNFEIKKIIEFSKKIISKAIALGGSSIKDFSSSSGKKGSFQQHFSVYGKKDENCSKVKCGGKIKKIVIANRASFFCNKCQK